MDARTAERAAWRHDQHRLTWEDQTTPQHVNDFNPHPQPLVTATSNERN